MLPGASFGIMTGIIVGISRSGPRSKSVLNPSAIASMPPMPTPTSVPTRSIAGLTSSE